MSTYKITIWGLENHLNHYNDSLFNSMVLPNGIDRELAKNRIMAKSGEFGLLFSEPTFLKAQIGIWSKTYYRTFEKWINAVNLDYNPIWNVDGTEEWTDERVETLRARGNTGRNTSEDTSSSSETSGTNTDRTSNTENSTHSEDNIRNGSNGNTRTISGDSTSELTKAAFNSDDYDSYEKTANDENSRIVDSGTNSTTDDINITDNKTGSGSSTATFSSEADNTGTLTRSENETRTNDEDNKITNKRIGRKTGNIGVTMTQTMLDAEYKTALFSVYDHIADLFIQEFCIQIY